MHKAMASTLYWEKMEDETKQIVKQCKTCQRFKKQKKKYGKVPPKDVDLIPFDTMRIDIIGPYPVTDQKGNDRILDAMSFVDPTTGWFEIAAIPDKTSVRISQIFNNTWLSHNPIPREKLSLMMGMSLRMTSYLFSGTSVLSVY